MSGTSATNGAPAYKRVLLKLSGEALMGDLDYGTDPERVQAVAQEIATVHHRGVEVAAVVGGGNIYRGLAALRAAWIGRPATTWECWPRS